MPNQPNRLDELANAFGRDSDPLHQFEETFHTVNVDPFEAYLERVKRPQDASYSTLKNYRYTFAQWREFMESNNRHPACPNDGHVKQFVTYLSEGRDNERNTILKKINNLIRAYEWWQDHHSFPHPTDYNPFQIAKREICLSRSNDKMKHPPLTIDDISSVIQDCKNVRKRLFLVTQFKLGLRVGELLNIRLEDIALSTSDMQRWYPEMGTVDSIADYKDAIYIPSRYEREGNKSHQARVLPLDDEMKRTLLRYLPTRPSVDNPWLILSQRTFEKIERGDQVNQVWKTNFASYNENTQYRDITSHYGRYFFTNYWKVHETIPRELVQYMRGDKLGNNRTSESIDDYLTAHYEDVEELYLNRIFKVL